MNGAAGAGGGGCAPLAPPPGRDPLRRRWRSERPVLLGVLLTLLLHLPLLLAGRALSRRPAPPVEVEVRLVPLVPATAGTPLALARRLAVAPPRPHRHPPVHRPRPHPAPAVPVVAELPPEPVQPEPIPAPPQVPPPAAGTGELPGGDQPAPPLVRNLGGDDGGATTPPPPLASQDQGGLPSGLPRDGEIDYRVTKGSGEWRSGRGTLRWHIDGDHYRLDLEAHAEGLPALFYWAGVHWSSEGGILPDRLQPLRFMKGGGAGVDIDPQGHTATFRPAGTVRPLPDGLQDLLSVFFQFAVRPPAEDNMDFPVTNGDKIDRYAFEMTDRGPLKVDLGEFDTVHISRVHKLTENGFEIWLAPARNFLPVQMRLYHARLGVLSLYATGLRAGGPGGPKQEP